MKDDLLKAVEDVIAAVEWTPTSFTIGDGCHQKFEALRAAAERFKAEGGGWVDEQTVYGHLIAFVAECGMQKVAAQRLGVSPQYLCDLILKRRALSGSTVLRALGFYPATFYRPLPAPPAKETL